jgi:hypothetical protein
MVDVMFSRGARVEEMENLLLSHDRVRKSCEVLFINTYIVTSPPITDEARLLMLTTPLSSQEFLTLLVVARSRSTAVGSITLLSDRRRISMDLRVRCEVVDRRSAIEIGTGESCETEAS